MEEMTVPPAISENWDNILHHIKNKSIANSYTNTNNNKLIIFSHDDINKIINENSNNKINNGKWRGQRAIGVVYNPQYEKYGNYVSTNLSLRYDAFLFIDETHALNPLHMKIISDRDLPETFPTGVQINFEVAKEKIDDITITIHLHLALSEVVDRMPSAL